MLPADIIRASGAPYALVSCAAKIRSVGVWMFTTIALALAVGLAWFASRKNEKDRSEYDRSGADLWPLTLHIRQDLKLISFLLFGVVVMLGIIADRIH